jgi:hypothetical protein
MAKTLSPACGARANSAAHKDDEKVCSPSDEAIGGLVAFPHQGHKRPDLTTRPLRFQSVRDYLIAYAPEEKPLLVIAVLHGRRSPQAISTILEQRQ